MRYKISSSAGFGWLCGASSVSVFVESYPVSLEFLYSNESHNYVDQVGNYVTGPLGPPRRAESQPWRQNASMLANNAQTHIKARFMSASGHYSAVWTPRPINLALWTTSLALFSVKHVRKHSTTPLFVTPGTLVPSPVPHDRWRVMFFHSGATWS